MGFREGVSAPNFKLQGIPSRTEGVPWLGFEGLGHKPATSVAERFNSLMHVKSGERCQNLRSPVPGPRPLPAGASSLCFVHCMRLEQPGPCNHPAADA